jgi:hypothetical protein
VFIRVVDEGLERLLRAELPLPTDIGDITFDAPSRNWSAELSRLTVNLFLYDVTRSSVPSQSPTVRATGDGRGEQRAPQPMMQLSYLVSAWAGSPRDEHQLLGQVVSCLAGRTSLAVDFLPSPLSSPVHLSLREDEHNKLREIWTSAGGQLKASFTLIVTVAADTFDWTEQAPLVKSVEALAAPIPARAST